jgi:hypothetical protein
MADTTMFTKYAEQHIMQGIKNWIETGTCRMYLLKSDFTLNIDTDLSSISGLEADFDGYDRKTLGFGAVGLDANKKAYITASGVQWTMNGSNGNTIYGWIIDTTITGHRFLIEAKKYSQSAPDNRRDMTTSGNTLSITPTVKTFDTSISV